jgi:hypothetical protein
MSTFLYTRPTERLGGTLAVNTGTEDTAYVAANLDDNLPFKPAKLTGTTGSWTRDLGSSLQVDFAAVIHHNLSAGLDLRLQGHPTDAWGAPDVNLAFTIPAAHADGFTKNVFLDVTAFVPLAANRTKRWWRLLINSANAFPVAVGEWTMYSAIRNFGIRNISKGSTRRTLRPSVVHETELLFRRGFDLGTTLRACDVELEATDVTRDDVDALYRSASGEVKPFVIVPHREQDEPWFVTLVGEAFEYERAHRNYNPLSLSFQELARGLTL